ncbi:MAG TPA: branched-chain amino acid ABC transporter substrate-binding protein [Ktedonosporobacter sp.]|nr:branched-chain amino acid ABC transporter substrate-binding protein [Ktedonosporobacter sp.]
MRRRWSRIFAQALGVPMLLVLLAACGAGTGAGTATTPSASSGPITIKIGSDFPTSGKDASAGKPSEDGAHFAVDQANANKTVPGVTFVFVPKDDVGPSGTHDGATGAKNVTDLIGDAQVAGIVGPLNSSVAQAELPVTNQAPIALISPANTNDCLTKETPDTECGGANSKIAAYRPTGKTTYFRIATRDVYQGRVLADFAYTTKGWKKAYLIDDAETYGVGIADSISAEWKTLGGTLINRSSVPGTTTSYVGLLTQIASTNPDVIFFGGNDSTGGILIRQQMAQIPALKNTPFISGDGSNTPAMAKAIQPLGGGPVFTSVVVDYKATTSATDFAAKFQAAYPTLGAYTPGAYDSANILIQAIGQVVKDGKVAPPKDSGDATGAKAFRQAVIDAMQGITYTGVTGTHSFDKDGDTTNRNISIFTLGDLTKNNGWAFVTEINAQG